MWLNNNLHGLLNPQVLYNLMELLCQPIPQLFQHHHTADTKTSVSTCVGGQSIASVAAAQPHFYVGQGLQSPAVTAQVELTSETHQDGFVFQTRRCC